MKKAKLQPVDFETFQTMKKYSDMFETQSCSRCGGSGKYSWCQMYGDTCFKCQGLGKYFTKRGAEMRGAYLEQRKMNVEDLETEGRYHGMGYKFTVAEKIISENEVTIVTKDGMKLITDLGTKVEFIGLTAEQRYQHYLKTFEGAK